MCLAEPLEGNVLAMSFMLEYGMAGRWNWTPPSRATLVHHGGPARAVAIGPAVTAALSDPLDFPPLADAVIPDDRVVLVLERRIPGSAEIVAAVWQVLEQAGVVPKRVCVLQPAAWIATETADPRELLPATVRQEMRWLVHDATRTELCGYLASSAGGERIYLHREVLDADVVLPISPAAFDPVLGYRGPGAVIYPGLSTSKAFSKTLGLGHRELRPNDERPLTQLIEEIVWLLGVQAAIQTVPHRASGSVAAVLAGSVEAVSRQTRKLLDREWRLSRKSRSDTVVAAVTSSAGPTSWEDVASAVEAARQLVCRGGRIVVLSDLVQALGPGMELVRSQPSARQALRELRAQTPPDWLVASQWASAADWAQVYLLSGLDSGLVEELFVTPLANEAEAQRVIDMAEDCVLLAGAQHTYAEISS